ncbi:MAG: ABC transporter substrate-binding protein [Kiritimatiellae bacterium]|jgi:NitT/TauT family transport system substrate-binding protein|nr:ABC transporter substrate-binding protein [Kiritimatiellia bacterium]
MRILQFFSIMALLFSAGCEKQKDARHLAKINVQLGWQVNANSAGQIVALEKGYYREVGLDVELFPGGLNNPSIQAVASGSVDVGFANSPDLIVKARDAGAPLKILAVIHQQSYHGFFAREDSGIKCPKDWEGKRIGVKFGSPTYLYYQAICRKLKIDRKLIKEVPIKYGLIPFLNGDLDVYPGALTNEKIAIEKEGIKLRVIKPSDYGISTWGNVVFTSELAISNRGQDLKKFVQATIRGWKFCLSQNHEEEVLEFLKKHSSKIDIEKERIALRETVKLVSSKEIGTVDTEELSDIIEQLKESGLISESMTTDQLLIKEQW